VDIVVHCTCRKQEKNGRLLEMLYPETGLSISTFNTGDIKKKAIPARGLAGL
jgi:hypothetical protein